MSEEIKLTIHPFRMDTKKQAALKPLEESAEVFGSWQDFDPYRPRPECYDAGYPNCTGDCRRHCETFKNPESYEIRCRAFADEIADCIQACVNLGDRYGIDLQAAMERCEERNRKRGRYE